MAVYTSVQEVISPKVMVVALITGTLLLFVVYLYVIEHFNKMDQDIDEVVSLLQTKALMNHRK